MSVASFRENFFYLCAIAIEWHPGSLLRINLHFFCSISKRNLPNRAGKAGEQEKTNFPAQFKKPWGAGKLGNFFSHSRNYDSEKTIWRASLRFACCIWHDKYQLTSKFLSALCRALRGEIINTFATWSQLADCGRRHYRARPPPEPLDPNCFGGAKVFLLTKLNFISVAGTESNKKKNKVSHSSKADGYSPKT
jgi:hypothetical protein